MALMDTDHDIAAAKLVADLVAVNNYGLEWLGDQKPWRSPDLHLKGIGEWLVFFLCRNIRTGATEVTLIMVVPAPTNWTKAPLASEKDLLTEIGRRLHVCGVEWQYRGQ